MNHGVIGPSTTTWAQPSRVVLVTAELEGSELASIGHRVDATRAALADGQVIIVDAAALRVE